MPYLKLNTNVPIKKEQSPELMTGLTQLISHETGKSDRYIMIELSSDNTMLFAGSCDPLAYLECKSIGLSASQAKSLSKSLCNELESALKIPPDRIYIEFSNAPADFWGWNGSTFG